MQPLFDWLNSGSPPHYVHLLVCLMMVIEYIVGKTDKIKPNSVLDLLLHVVTGNISNILNKSGVKVPTLEGVKTEAVEPAKEEVKNEGA